MRAAQTLLLAVLLMTLLGFAQSPVDARTYSQLWGEAGERWSDDSRLPDFSFAGFERGEQEIPDFPDAPEYDVRDYGAVGDGEADDTQAFIDAIAAASEVDGPAIVKIPAGRYVITDILGVGSSQLVVRGEGRGQTTLYFPKSLSEARPNSNANFSWSGGFIRVYGSDSGQNVSDVVEPARRGDRALVLDDASGLSTGDELRLIMRDDDEFTLAHYLYTDDPGGIDRLGRLGVSQVVRVVSIDSNLIMIDRPLRFDVRDNWQPRVNTFEPQTTHVGIERLTFRFPTGDYEGHLTEAGYNAISIGSSVAHGWVRDIAIINAESGIFSSGRFWTLKDIHMTTNRSPSNQNHRGHHALTLSGQDTLLTRFSIAERYIHDITVTRGSIGNVVSRGQAVDLNLDHHRRAPYENLFTDLNAGQGSRLWSSGGGGQLGRNAAARNTYWNIRARQTIDPPRDSFAPDMINLVGVTPEAAEQLEENGKWIEPIPPGAVRPRDLHKAQLERRLAND